GAAALSISALSMRTWSDTNISPVASLQADLTAGTAPLSVQFDASASQDTDGTISYYLWDLDGDGAYERTSFVPLTGFSYPTAGIKTASVAVVDDEGAYGTAQLQIAVDALPLEAPSAVITADRSDSLAPFVISFDASGSTDPDGSIVQYEWDFDNDGSFESY